ncbi:lysophospholipid acyltransferase family protein [Xylophilus sp.]|uniref:lysophospholipid acyltransferase family protein n=1 Tax=Xylophilus sp. TaxID=2653893 RepID=UPI0013B99D8E|nr:lysophospholipid acyltransferase family protein [Xylophilus sp.]KAF1047675.1 MAG: Lipid A biosynthesis palmitoleoyltransferase [Xylophilus sp.]
MPALFCRLPLWFAHAVGAVLGWLVFLLSPTYRRRFIAHARLAGYRFGAVRGAVAHAGCMVTELPRLWWGAPVRCTWASIDVVHQAYAAGRGVVYLTPHLGCFEVSPQVAARDFTAEHGPITVLFRPARQPWLAGLMADSRRRPGLETAPTTLAGVRQMIRALRQGRAVGLLPDQVPPEGQGLWSPFFGRPAYTMTLAARLAQQTGAAVVLVRCERLARGRGFVLHPRGLAEPLAADLEMAVGQINREMEHLIREAPQQYLWGYSRYKTPRREV